MVSKDIRQKYIDFFKKLGHKEIAPAKLVPENDPTTLFTSSGMQPLVPYLLGQEHPEGKRLVNSQPSFRAEDIEEIGDNRHTTFFEMLGNWSLGDYFKKEQLSWIWEFLTKELGLPKEKLYVSVFDPSASLGTGGNDEVPKDTESLDVWKSLGVEDDHIFFYGVDKNWWSRSGPPDKMPIGEIGGPDSEVFYDFGTTHGKKFGENCHPNCNCGRFLEIGNSVFIQYQKQEDGSLKELAQKNVDFGGGLERLTAATLDTTDVFQTDLYVPIIRIIEQTTTKNYKDIESKSDMRIIVDHLRAAIFLITQGVEPSNKMQGYVLRRLLRRVAVKMRALESVTNQKDVKAIADAVLSVYDGIYFNKKELQDAVSDTIGAELNRFTQTLDKGLREIQKVSQIDGKIAFDLYQTYGFPLEITEELFREKGQFKREFEKHRELSRTASAGIFKGGLADHSEVVIKYHTATHLLHQALRDVLGPTVFQRGSNITTERLRFDFSFDRKMTDEEIKQVEDLVNQRIHEDLKVDHLIISLEEAKKMNAIGLFDEKYAIKVSIYGVGPEYKLDSDAKDTRARGGYYSLEFCGGPHVENTGVLGTFKIVKEEAVSAGVRRIKAVLTN